MLLSPPLPKNRSYISSSTKGSPTNNMIAACWKMNHKSPKEVNYYMESELYRHGYSTEIVCHNKTYNLVLFLLAYFY